MIALYQKIMRIQAPIAASENELRIPIEIEPYSTSGGDAKRTVVLSLVFNPANRRLAGAQVRPLLRVHTSSWAKHLLLTTCS